RWTGKSRKHIVSDSRDRFIHEQTRRIGNGSNAEYRTAACGVIEDHFRTAVIGIDALGQKDGIRWRRSVHLVGFMPGGPMRATLVQTAETEQLILAEVRTIKNPMRR